MIKGIGIDIIEFSRIQSVFKRQPKFIERVLTPAEQEQFHQLSERRQLEFLAGRFAAKEAFAKALGTGIGTELSFQDIEIIKDEKGKPYIPYNEYIVHVSISHSIEYAVAQVVIEEI
ncbi:holo-ACP synthase [Aeribacillus pallidus]|jgi:holo-[acyl-carrier protein] synthase|uniref:holo-ACP synthase n=1 Tax=Aeribacillus pallidus TaxID=33936 RepID=UPI003D1CB200